MVKFGKFTNGGKCSIDISYINKSPTEFVRHGEVTQRKCYTSYKENFRHNKIHGLAEKQAKYRRKCSTYKIIHKNAGKPAEFDRKCSTFINIQKMERTLFAICNK